MVEEYLIKISHALIKSIKSKVVKVKCLTLKPVISNI